MPSNITAITQNRFFPFILIFAVGFLIYGHILHAPFIFDEHELLLADPLIKDIARLFENWQDVARKFLTLLTYAVNYHFGGLDPFGYHLVNVLSHILTTFLLYAVILNLYSTPVLTETAFTKEKRSFGLTCALIFLVHPLQTQSVTYIWERSEVLSGFFYLLAFFLYLQARVKKRRHFFIYVLLLYYAGFFVKATIVTLPLMIVLTEFCFLSHEKTKRILLWTWPFVFMGCGLGLMFYEKFRFILDRIHLGFLVRRSSDISLSYLYAQFEVIPRYIQLAFLPIGQNLDHHVPLVENFFNVPTILSFLFLVTVIGVAAYLFKVNRFMTFGIFWFFIYLIPTSSVFLLDPMWEHRVYVSMAGFAMFVAAWLWTALKKQKVKNIVAICLIVILCGLTVARNMLWRSPIALFEDTVRKSPKHPRPHHILGTLYFQNGDSEKAFVLFQKAIALGANYAEPHNNLGLIYMRTGEWQRAEEEFQKAIAIREDFIFPYINLGYIALAKRDFEQAQQQFEKSLNIKITDQAYLGLGQMYLAQRGTDQAVMSFKRALNINPENYKAYLSLGNIYLSEKQYPLALENYKEAIKVKPDSVEAHINLGIVYYDTNNYKEAQRSFETALSIDPTRLELNQYLAKVHFALGEFEKGQEYLK